MPSPWLWERDPNFLFLETTHGILVWAGASETNALCCGTLGHHFRAAGIWRLPESCLSVYAQLYPAWCDMPLRPRCRPDQCQAGCHDAGRWTFWSLCPLPVCDCQRNPALLPWEQSCVEGMEGTGEQALGHGLSQVTHDSVVNGHRLMRSADVLVYTSVVPSIGSSLEYWHGRNPPSLAVNDGHPNQMLAASVSCIESNDPFLPGQRLIHEGVLPRLHMPRWSIRLPILFHWIYKPMPKVKWRKVFDSYRPRRETVSSSLHTCLKMTLLMAN